MHVGLHCHTHMPHGHGIHHARPGDSGMRDARHAGSRTHPCRKGFVASGALAGGADWAAAPAAPQYSGHAARARCCRPVTQDSGPCPSTHSHEGMPSGVEVGMERVGWAQRGVDLGRCTHLAPPACSVPLAVHHRHHRCFLNGVSCCCHALEGLGLPGGIEESGQRSQLTLCPSHARSRPASASIVVVTATAAAQVLSHGAAAGGAELAVRCVKGGWMRDPSTLKGGNAS